MTVYRYDLGELEETQGNLENLSDDFAGASEAREGAAGDMGYGDLRDAIKSFTDNWKHNRDKQLEAIDGAASMLGDIVTNYRDFDQGAVDSLLNDD